MKASSFPLGKIAIVAPLVVALKWVANLIIFAERSILQQTGIHGRIINSPQCKQQRYKSIDDLGGLKVLYYCNNAFAYVSSSSK